MDALQEELHLLPQLEIQRTERLVKEENARPAHERASECHPLLLATRELARLAVPDSRQLDKLQHVFHASLDLALGDTLPLETEGDVVGDREMRKERIRLEHGVDIAFVRRLPDNVLLAEEDASLVRLLEAADHPERRRLAATGRAEQREEPAVLHFERQIVHCHDTVETLRDAFQADVCHPLRHGIRTPHS